MARDRLFDEGKVLQAAADLFAMYGYQGTSLSMLLEATGLGKQSLYNTFGDKRSLYLKAMDCAVARGGAMQAAMDAAASGRAAVQELFDGLLSQCTSGNAVERSCVVSSGLLEDIGDSAIRHHLLDKWRHSHELLRQAVERGQKDGSIRNPAPSVELADLLMSLISGLRVAARSDATAQRLARSVELGLSLLDRA